MKILIFVTRRIPTFHKNICATTLLWIFASIFMSSCSSTLDERFAADDIASIKNVRVIFATSDQYIYYRCAITDSSIFSLEWDKTQCFTDEEKESIRSAIYKDGKLNERIKNGFSDTLTSYNQFRITSFSEDNNLEKDEILLTTAKMKEDYLLVIKPSVVIPQFIGHIELSVNLSIYPKIKNISESDIRKNRVRLRSTATNEILFQSNLVTPELRSLSEKLARIESSYQNQLRIKGVDRTKAKDLRRKRKTQAVKSSADSILEKRDVDYLANLEMLTSLYKEGESIEIEVDEMPVKASLSQAKEHLKNRYSNFEMYELENRRKFWMEDNYEFVRENIILGSKQISNLARIAFGNISISSTLVETRVFLSGSDPAYTPYKFTDKMLTAYQLPSSNEDRSYFLIEKLYEYQKLPDYISIPYGQSLIVEYGTPDAYYISPPAY